MLTQTFFNSNDTDRIQKSYNRVKTISYILLVIGIPAEFLIGFLASRRYPTLLWPIALFGLIVLLLLFYFTLFKMLRLQKRDLTEQTKLVGSLRVISKSEKEKQLLIGFDSAELEQISLNKIAFDKVRIGDDLSIEFSKYGKHVFRLSKADEIIISGS